VHRRLIEDEHEILTVALAPDGVTLASGGLDARVTLWDLETGLEKTTFLGHTGAVTSLAFTQDGRMLASASQDHTLKVWDVATGREALSVTWLEPREAPPIDLGSESSDSGRGAPGRDRCADGPDREADCSGA
jgi:WD40 repeat protein